MATQTLWANKRAEKKDRRIGESRQKAVIVPGECEFDVKRKNARVQIDEKRNNGSV